VQTQETTRTGRYAHLPKGTLSNDPMEIKVIQVNFAFKVYWSGETTAHISSAAWGWVRWVVVARVKGKGGDKERKERLNNISKAVSRDRQGHH